ncbi:fasciclin domain-containing protein [Pontibacter roseus]|uniref:fasciclin domain-containing protein n=1 Tax=Pontibacter roseus TaxID=336989 RepID=UPI0003625A5C|nr:fasciclin domain-containing protein [Pontibacter roseus]
MKTKPTYTALWLLLIVSLFLCAGAVTAQDAAQAQRTTIMQYAIEERPVLADLLTAAGLAPALSGDTPYTLLAPPEESLRKLKGEPTEKIRSTLAAHIIKGSYKENEFKEGAAIQDYSGNQVHVCRKKGQTLLNGEGLSANHRQMRNGVVLELSGLLVP